MINEVKIGEEVVVLDGGKLKFNSHNINEFLSNLSVLYYYYYNKYAEAQKYQGLLETKLEALYGSKFQQIKENGGGSDKFCEMKVAQDQEILSLQQDIINSKYVSSTLYGWVKSVDYSFNCAKEFCYNMRKELDKLSKTLD